MRARNIKPGFYKNEELAENKRRSCNNCAHEGDRSSPKCMQEMTRAYMKNGGRGCLYHQFRPGWDLEGGLFDPRINPVARTYSDSDI
jgi:hypothetical protein